MERIARSIQNKKQDKIALVQIQPSVNSLREGEEVLFNNSNGMLVRYSKQNGRLWSSNMTDNGNMLVDKKLTRIPNGPGLQTHPNIHLCKELKPLVEKLKE